MSPFGNSWVNSGFISKKWGYVMATGRVSQPVGERLDSLPPLPHGVIPQPRARIDPPLAPSASRRRKVLLVAVPAVVAVGIGVTLLGLTQRSAPADAGVPVVPRSAEDVGFLKTVRQQAGFAALSDDSMVRIGHMLCSRLQGGVSPDDIALGSSGAGFSIEDVSTAVGAAAGAYCPDQITRVSQPG